MQVYGYSDPPEYKVENVKVPVATYRGKNDYLTSDEVGARGCNEGIQFVSLQIDPFPFYS